MEADVKTELEKRVNVGEKQGSIAAASQVGPLQASHSPRELCPITSVGCLETTGILSRMLLAECRTNNEAPVGPDGALFSSKPTRVLVQQQQQQQPQQLAVIDAEDDLEEEEEEEEDVFSTGRSLQVPTHQRSQECGRASSKMVAPTTRSVQGVWMLLPQTDLLEEVRHAEKGLEASW
ncbi:hypothetical protein BDP55DRAFT_721903, partial [Colletotrichum godetiae]